MNKMYAMKSASLRAVAGFVLVALLSACGGGGGSAGDRWSVAAAVARAVVARGGDRP